MKLTTLLKASISALALIACCSLNAIEQPRKGKRNATEANLIDDPTKKPKFIHTVYVTQQDLINNNTFQKKMAEERQYFTNHTFIAHVKLDIDVMDMSVEQLQQLLALFTERSIDIVEFYYTVHITEDNLESFLALKTTILKLEKLFAPSSQPIRIRLAVSNTTISTRQLQTILCSIRHQIVALDCFNCKKLTILEKLPDSLQDLNCECCDDLKILKIPQNLQTLKCWFNYITEVIMSLKLKGTDKGFNFENMLIDGRGGLPIKFIYV